MALSSRRRLCLSQTSGVEVSGTNLGEAAGWRVDKPGGLCQAFGLPARAPTDDVPVRPPPAGVVKASRDLCVWDVRTPDWSGIRRDFGLFCGFLGRRRRRYGRRLSVGIRCRCLGRGLLSWLFRLRGCWSATVVQIRCCRRAAAHDEHQGGYGEAEYCQHGAGPLSGQCHLLFVLSGRLLVP